MNNAAFACLATAAFCVLAGCGSTSGDAPTGSNPVTAPVSTTQDRSRDDTPDQTFGDANQPDEPTAKRRDRSSGGSERTAGPPSDRSDAESQAQGSNAADPDLSVEGSAAAQQAGSGQGGAYGGQSAADGE